MQAACESFEGGALAGGVFGHFHASLAHETLSEGEEGKVHLIGAFSTGFHVCHSQALSLGLGGFAVHCGF